MNVLWGTVMAAIGALLAYWATIRSEFVAYRLLVARSRVLWGDRVHRFHQAICPLILIQQPFQASKVMRNAIVAFIEIADIDAQ